jgi:hypothetical protein
MNTASTPVSVAPHARARGRAARTFRPPRAVDGLRTALLAVVDSGTTSLKAAAVRVRRLLGRPVTDGDRERDEHHPRSTSDVLVGGPNMRFFHRADCQMATDREWSEEKLDEQGRTGRSPCGMCRP